MSIEDRLSAWGEAARSSTGAPPEVPVGRFGNRRHRVLVAAPVAAALAVLVAIGGGALLGNWPRGTSGEDTLGKTRPYTHRGLTLSIPTSWQLGGWGRCTGPRNHSIIWSDLTSGNMLGMYVDCRGAKPRHSSFVVFADALSSIPMTGVETSDVTIGGYQATKEVGTSTGFRNNGDGRQLAAGDQVVVLTVPALQASVAIQAPDRGLVDAIAATARIVRKDANGCVVRRDDLGTLPTGRPPARAGADTALIPGSPRQIAVCGYDNGRLDRGITLSDAARDKLADAINTLPAGLSEARKRDGDCAGAPREALTIVATYDNGPPVTVWVRLGGCHFLGASNGTRTAQRTHGLLGALPTFPGDGISQYPDHVNPMR